MKHQMYRTLLLSAFVVAASILQPVYAEEAGLEIEAEDEEIIVEQIEIVEDEPPEEPLPDDLVLTDSDGEEITTDEEEAELPEEEPTDTEELTIEANISNDEEETSTLTIEKIEEEDVSGQALSVGEPVLILEEEEQEEVLEPVNIELRIEGPDGQIAYKPLSVPYSCEVTDSTGATSTFEGYMAICALVQALEDGKITSYQVTDWGFGFALDSINGIANAADWSESWVLRLNNATADVGIDQVVLSALDELLLTYGPWPAAPLSLELSESEITLGESATATLTVWDDTLEAFAEYEGEVTYLVDGAVVTTTDGLFVYTPEASGLFSVTAEAAGYTRSKPVSLSVPEPLGPISIDLRIEGPDATLVDTAIDLPVDCELTDSADETHTFETHVAICALDVAHEEGLISEFNVTDWGFAFALDSIADIANAADWSESWILRVNSALSDVGIDQVVLDESDELLFTYGPWDMAPLMVEVSTTSATVGDDIILTPYMWSDESAAFTEISGEEVLFHIGSSTTTATGTLSWTITETAQSNIWIEMDGKTRSPLAVLAISDVTPPPSGGGGGGGGSTQNDFSPSNADIQAAIDSILTYAKAQQSEDGSIIDGGTTDWLLMSFSANGDNPYDITSASSSLMQYALAYDFNGFTDLNLCAGYPRHVLALLAGGVSSNATEITSLTEKMNADCHADGLYGQPGINDDVFALMALLATGESTSASIVTDIMTTILEDQTAEGAFTWAGWAGADITGAAVNALTYAQTKGLTVEQTVITDAAAYLKQEQLSDGGWGFGSSDALTTSWAVMGINALGESQSDWLTTAGYTPWNTLVDALTDDGYYESAWAPGSVDWFAMKHAVPALLGTSWPIIGSFTETPSTEQPTTGGSGGGGGGTPDTAKKQAADTVKSLFSEENSDVTLKSQETLAPKKLADASAESLSETFADAPEPVQEAITNALQDKELVDAPITATVDVIEVSGESTTSGTYTSITREISLTEEDFGDEDEITIIEIIPKSFIESAADILGSFVILEDDPVIAFTVTKDDIANGRVELSYAAPSTGDEQTAAATDVYTTIIAGSVSTSTPDIVVEDTATTTEAVLLEEAQVAEPEETAAEPLALGGGDPAYVAPDPAVAGVKIAAAEVPADKQAPSDAEEEQSVDTEALVEEVAAKKTGSNAFAISLGITILLAIALGWRFMRSLV